MSVKDKIKKELEKSKDILLVDATARKDREMIANLYRALDRELENAYAYFSGASKKSIDPLKRKKYVISNINLKDFDPPATGIGRMPPEGEEGGRTPAK